MVTGGSNTHTTIAEEVNALATDFVTQGVVGAITLNTGSGGTGSFCVNADASPDMGVTVKAGQAYITATPSSQDSQVLRARAAANYTAYTINANASGSTKYDWIYLKVDATKANNPAADASDVTSLVTSRSSSNSTDNGSPPTYGLLLAIVTVANGASSITNSNITDKRFNTSIGAQNGSLIVTQASTGTDAIIQAAGIDANVNINLSPKGTGNINGVVNHLYNPYKFSVYLNSSYSTNSAARAIPMDTKLFDTGTNVDIATNKGRFTAPTAGFYWFTAATAFNAAQGYRLFTSIYKNGSEVLRGNDDSINVSPYGFGGSAVTGILSLSTNDYVEPYAYSNGSVPLQNSSFVTYFQGFLVSAT